MVSSLFGSLLRKIRAGTAILLVICTSLVSAKILTDKRSESAQCDTLEAIATAEQYILREYDGRVGVFSVGDDTPREILPIYVIYLPSKDREDLARGIYVSGTDALRSIINDLES